MFVLIIKRFNAVVKSEEPSQWRSLLISIKIFIDWMLCNSGIWQPFPDQLPPDLGPNPNRWQIIANMLNLVSGLHKKEWNEMVCGRVKLDEDLELVGFVPLLALPRESNGSATKEEMDSMMNLDESSIEQIKVIDLIFFLFNFDHFCRALS